MQHTKSAVWHQQAFLAVIITPYLSSGLDTPTILQAERRGKYHEPLSAQTSVLPTEQLLRLTNVLQVCLPSRFSNTHLKFLAGNRQAFRSEAVCRSGDVALHRPYIKQNTRLLQTDVHLANLLRRPDNLTQCEPSIS